MERNTYVCGAVRCDFATERFLLSPLPSMRGAHAALVDHTIPENGLHASRRAIIAAVRTAQFVRSGVVCRSCFFGRVCFAQNGQYIYSLYTGEQTKKERTNLHELTDKSTYTRIHHYFFRWCRGRSRTYARTKSRRIFWLHVARNGIQVSDAIDETDQVRRFVLLRFVRRKVHHCGNGKVCARVEHHERRIAPVAAAMQKRCASARVLAAAEHAQTAAVAI